MKIIRITFQLDNSEKVSHGKRMILVLDLESDAGLSTNDIPSIIKKMQIALPGIFPSGSDPLAHNCGASDEPFLEELERGTDIPHLFEHVLLHLLSRRTYACSGFCGQRSIDIEAGITSHYYIVLDCPSELEAVVASGIAFELVSAWIEGRNVTIYPEAVLKNIQELIEPMVKMEEISDSPLSQY